MELVLDSMIVSALCTPRTADHKKIAQWFIGVLRKHRGPVVIVLPEIVDYEVRRGLLHHAKKNQRSISPGLTKLDTLGTNCKYLPIKTSMMKKAAELWAESRIRGQPTGAPETLDADPILAAQALEGGGTVVTENVRHLAQFVRVKPWSAIDPVTL